MRPDTQKAIHEYDIPTFGVGNKNAIEKAENLLNTDEKVLYVRGTNLIVKDIYSRKKETLPGIVFITDKRFVFSCNILAKSNFESVSLEDINSVTSEGNGLTGGHVIINTVTKSYDILTRYKKEDIIALQTVIQDAISSKKNIKTLASANVTDDYLEQIEKMAALYEKGILTEEEFNKKKKQLLGI